MNDDINTLRRILKETKTIAVVGLSANWWRPSYFAAKYLQDHGYRVIPVNPQYQEVLGEKCYPSLRDVPLEVDVVDCFRKSEEIPDLADEAIAIGAKVLWMQLGVINDAAAQKASQAGLEVVMDRCMKIEHGRLFGGLNYQIEHHLFPQVPSWRLPDLQPVVRAHLARHRVAYNGVTWREAVRLVAAHLRHIARAT
jgi:predicted CoA-binding protein